MVREGEVDFGIAGMARADAELDSTPLLVERLGLVARRDDPLLSLGRLTWRALGGRAVVGLPHDDVTQRLIEAVPGAPQPLRQPQYEVANNGLLAQWVSAGAAIAVLGSPASRHPALASLGFRCLTDPAQDRVVLLHARAAQQPTPVARALMVAVQAPARRLDDPAHGLWARRAALGLR